MSILRIPQKLSILTRLFSDEGLTRKAYLNSITSTLEFGAKSLVAFVLIPIMVASLGDYYFGLWQILNRAIGYISSTGAKPTQALKWSLANHKNSDDFQYKRNIVGSAIVVWILFLPILAVAGGCLSWYLPIWLEVSEEAYLLVRITAGIMVVDLIMTNLAALPRSILLGENLGYKRMGLSALLAILGGTFTWAALMLDAGLVGLALATLSSTIMGGAIYLSVVKKFVPWYGISKPSRDLIRKFFHLSGWFLIWDLLLNLMISSDVIVLGLLQSVDSVTSYTITKYVPEMITSIIGIIVLGILPGMGGIIGSGDMEKASHVRSEIMALSWLTMTCLGATIILWNPVFLHLWVETDQYAGTLANLLTMVFVTQFAFITNDASIINLSLRIQWKVWLGAISVVLCLVIATILVNIYHFGLVGMLIGFILGRSILSISYPIVVGRFLKINLSSQLRSSIQPLLVMILLFITAALLSENLSLSFNLTGFMGWLTFVLFAGISAVLFLIISFYTGLSGRQRRRIVGRASMVLFRR